MKLPNSIVKMPYSADGPCIFEWIELTMGVTGAESYHATKRLPHTPCILLTLI